MNFDNRKCTDVFCLILFVLNLLGMIAIFWYAITYGNLNKVLCGNDFQGNFCGVGNMTDYPYVYFSNYTVDANQKNNTLAEDKIFRSAICVKECPVGGDVICSPDTDFSPGGTCNNPFDI